MKKTIKQIALPALLLLSLSFVVFNAQAEGEKNAKNDTKKANTTVIANKVVYISADIKPEPAGNMGAFYTYLREKAVYPKEARENGIEGKMYVGFVVNADGTLSDVKVLKGLGAGCDEEAVRLIESASNWIPGQQAGQNVNVQMILPITFKLDW